MRAPSIESLLKSHGRTARLRVIGWTLALGATGPAALQAAPQLLSGPEPSRSELRGGDLPSPDGRFLPQTRRELELYQRYGDHHVGVVGEEIITRIDVLAFQQTPDFEDPVAERTDLTPEQAGQERFFSALAQVMEQRLKVQGGRAQGFEPELVRQAIEDQFERYEQSFGGYQGAGSRLADFSFTPTSFREYLEERLMASLWEDSVTGRAPGPAGRIFVDLYQRPGKIFSRYREYLESPDPRQRARVGKTQGRISLRFLVIKVDPQVGPEDARRLAAAARQNVLEKTVPLDDLIQQYAPTSYRGDAATFKNELTEWVGIRMAREFGDQAEAFVEFVQSAPVGGLSPVLTIEQNGAPQLYVLYQVTERQGPTEATPFATRELQDELRTELLEEASTERINRGLAELVRSSHVAPPELRQLFLQSGELRTRRRR